MVSKFVSNISLPKQLSHMFHTLDRLLFIIFTSGTLGCLIEKGDYLFREKGLAKT
jgi:hypothetical protein